MYHHIIIQLTEKLDKVQELGCIVKVKDCSLTDYKYFSLLKPDDRKEINRLVQKPERLSSIVKFDFDN